MLTDDAPSLRETRELYAFLQAILVTEKKIQLRQVRRGGSLSFPNSHVAYKSYTPLYLGAFVYDSFTKGKYVLIIDSQDFQNIDQLSNLLTCNNYKIKWIKLVYKY